MGGARYEPTLAREGTEGGRSPNAAASAGIKPQSLMWCKSHRKQPKTAYSFANLPIYISNRSRQTNSQDNQPTQGVKMSNNTQVKEQLRKLRSNAKVMGTENLRTLIESQEGLASVEWLEPFREVRRGHDSMFQLWNVTTQKVRDLIEANDLARTERDTQELVTQSTGTFLKVGASGLFRRTLAAKSVQWHPKAAELLEILKAELAKELDKGVA